MQLTASVIIPSLGRCARLGKCVESVLSQNSNQLHEIILSIDGEDSEQVATGFQHNYAGCTPILSSTSRIRRGSAKAKNDGASIASGDILVFVDDDVVVCEKWLQSILSTYDDNISGVGGSEMKSHAPGFLRRLMALAYGNATGKVTGLGNVISNFTPRKEEKECVDCLPGANMSFLRSAFRESGGFDENYCGTAYREETDLCLRLGGRSTLVFNPSAMVWHFEDSVGGNSPESLRLWNYWYHRNNTYFYLKNFHPDYAHWILHLSSEVLLAIGRCFMQTSIYPIGMMSSGIRDGRSVSRHGAEGIGCQ